MGKLMIRQHIRQQRPFITEERREGAARSIFGSIESIDGFRRANYIAIYHALADEIPTAQIIERWSAMGKTVLLPRVDGDKMEFYTLDSADLRIGSFGIVEPQGSEAIDPALIELMIVPGMAFCADGRRLGRGKGYYDRYLARCNKNLYKIGICFNFQLLDNIPCDTHDINMDRVCQEAEHPEEPGR